MSGDTARRLLLALSAHAPRSGSELASRAGVTRAAVWKQVEALRAAGVAIEAQAGRGYRLTAPVELLDAEAIAALLPAALRRRLGDFVVHWQIDSTNSALLRAAPADARALAACFAERQSQGRGRRGRAWHMPLGGGIALSLRRRFDTGMAGLAGLSLAVGVAVVRALEACGVPGCGLKWPNDVVVGERKLAGILIEGTGEAHGPCEAVIGIGLNLRLGAGAEAIGQPWIDLAGLVGAAMPGRNALAAQLLIAVVAATDAFAVDGLRSFAAEHARLDTLAGRPVRVLGTAAERSGIARGIDADGRLRVQGAEGEFVVDSGEVSVRADAGERA